MPKNTERDRSHFKELTEDGNLRCQSFVKGTDLQCPEEAVHGKRVCEDHGANSTGPKGHANNLKHGFNSMAYESMLRDRDTLEHVIVDPKKANEVELKRVTGRIEFLDDLFKFCVINQDMKAALEILELINATVDNKTRIINSINKINENGDNSKGSTTLVVIPSKALHEQYKPEIVVKDDNGKESN